MNRISMAGVLLVLAISLLSGCTWVKPTSDGEQVQVATANDVAGCESLGKVTVSLKHKVGRIERNQDKVKTELETLARNEGAAMGGDTVVAEGRPVEGRQTFGVYGCQSG
ncbi:MAG: DUF4156 domain-containing protein [Xanthomonadales bacterium]|nr:DUF4156 domain-containing protein [Xanthomonadales bacterium]